MSERPFRVLPEDEFRRLTTEQRAAYLREAVDALEELKSQLRRSIMWPPSPDPRGAVLSDEEKKKT